MVNVVETSSGAEKLVRTEEDDIEGFSWVQVVDKVDNLPLDYLSNKKFKANVYHLVTHTQIKVGFVLKFVVDELRVVCGSLVEETFEIDSDLKELRFRSTSFDGRNEQLDRIAREMNRHSQLEGIKGWRDEKYAVCDNDGPYVLIERAMAGLMGIITYGAHINGYVLDEATNKIKFWIPRRAATKPTWPLMLDNIIAGGLGYPCTIYETVLKESKEEANLDQDVIEANIKAAGVVSYLYFPSKLEDVTFKNESDFIVGEVEYVYDLKVPKDVIPTPNDGEVDSFNLLTLEQTVKALKRGEFKPNCALIMVDFLIRHGYITVENEPNYLQLVTRMHRMLPFPTIN